MTNLEIHVAALMKCVPQEKFNQAMQEVTLECDAVKEDAPTLETIQSEIKRVLNEIGIPAHLKGYRYIRSAIEMAVLDESVIGAITKELYPRVAEKYSTTASRAERAIRHAIGAAWDRGDTDVLYYYFGNTVDRSKGVPTNSEFIAMVSDHIREKIA